MTDHKKEIHLSGCPVSEGIAIGAAYFLEYSEEAIPEFPITLGEIDGEIARYRKALFSSREDLEKIQSYLACEGSEDAAVIIDTHIQMLDDPLITVHMEEKIRQMKQNTEAVFRSVIREFENRFKARDSFFQQRLVDVKDVSKRILDHLGNKQEVSSPEIPPHAVIFSMELAPSQIAAVSASRMGAFVTERGGGNSHAALIARAKGIPYVAGIDIRSVHQEPIDCVIVDGLAGEVILNPTSATLQKYQNLQACFTIRSEHLEKEAVLQAVTRDAVAIRLYANAGSLSDLETLSLYGAEGVGLFRTEYLLLDGSSTLPTEEEQYKIYRRLIEEVNGLPFIFRVFDIGGDKIPNAFLELKKEPNPVLGCRGIRLLLARKDVFCTQLRALLRASPYGDMRLLLPLITDLHELRITKQWIEEIKQELGITQSIPLGCMIEVPSSALIAEAIVQECDFLSIGTNDLMQYTLGVDRSNPAMSALCHPAHPSILRLIHFAALAANTHGKHIGICGEIASNPLFIPLLLGLGLREFSCAPRYLPLIKRAILSVDIASCERLAAKALTLATSSEIETLLHCGVNR